MTIAVCIYCGAKKFGAWTLCGSCGKRPTGSEDAFKSLMHSDHFLLRQEVANEDESKSLYQRLGIAEIDIGDSLEEIFGQPMDPIGEFTPCATEVHDPQACTSTMNACCIACGSKKDHPLMECSQCHYRPMDLNAISISMVLTNQYFSRYDLSGIRSSIRRDPNLPWIEQPQVWQLFQAWRMFFSDEQGELDAAKVDQYRMLNTTAPLINAQAKAPLETRQDVISDKDL